MRDGIVEPPLDDITPNHDADKDSAVPDSTDLPDAPNLELPDTLNTEPMAMEVTQPPRYPQRNRNQPDRYIEHY